MRIRLILIRSVGPERPQAFFQTGLLALVDRPVKLPPFESRRAILDAYKMTGKIMRILIAQPCPFRNPLILNSLVLWCCRQSVSYVPVAQADLCTDKGSSGGD